MGLINNKNKTIDQLKELERNLGDLQSGKITIKQFNAKQYPYTLAEAIDYVKEKNECELKYCENET